MTGPDAPAVDARGRPLPSLPADAPGWMAQAFASAPRTRRHAVEGVMIEVLEWGAPDAPPLLLIHGQGAHADWWRFIAPQLAATHRVIVPSLSGMGGSDWRESYGVDCYAREIAALIALVVPSGQPVAIAAHSYGCIVAMAAARLAGAAIGSLALIDFYIAPPALPPRRLSVRKARRYPSFVAAMARFHLSPPQTCDNVALLNHIARRTTCYIGGDDPHWSWISDPRTLIPTDHAVSGRDLSAIACPLLILRGGRSRLVDEAVVAHVRALAPDHARFAEIPDADHHVPLDQPLATVAALRTWLASLAPPRPRGDNGAGPAAAGSRLPGAGVVAPRQRDLAALAASLRRWLPTRLGAASDLTLDDFRYPQGAGLSHETILFEARWRAAGAVRRQGMVISIRPTGHTVYRHDGFEQQFRIMRALHDAAAVPIATPLWFEPDATIVGAPFFVMERRCGRVPISFPPYSREGWVTDLTPARRRILWRNAVGALAGIQSLPVAQARFLDPDGTFPDGFEQEWARWRDYFAWAAGGRPYPLLETVWARLEDTRPATRHPGIVWGDARIGNMMFDDDLNVAAVMDWEAAGLGGALHDLGYWTVMARIETEQNGLPRLDGMGSREETIALWGELTGIPTDDIAWYERFAAFKLSCLAIRLLALRGSDRPGMNRIDNPATRVLADLHGLPAPVPAGAAAAPSCEAVDPVDGGG